MPNSIWEELESFVRSEAEVSKNKILARQLGLERDMDLTGDDADDFMGKFFEKLKINHGDFEFSRYFSEEGFGPVVIIGMIFSKKIRKRQNKEALTLGMLEAAIQIGVWDSAELSASSL